MDFLHDVDQVVNPVANATSLVSILPTKCSLLVMIATTAIGDARRRILTKEDCEDGGTFSVFSSSN